MTNHLFNHQACTLSKLDMEMVRNIPPGGNWKNIPDEVVAKSKRLQGIRRTGGRTTYYGRLVWERPSYTINTFFNRPGNGCFIHPDQNRLISLREGARLQSFPDSFRFYGSKRSQYKQIGNAVPPLLARAIASELKGRKFIDLFAGAGGLAEGFKMVGFECLLAVDFDPKMCEVQRKNHVAKRVVEADLSKDNIIKEIYDLVESDLGGKSLDAIIGGPPCQGFSTAGWWNHNDSRNNLFKPFLQVVSMLLPRYVLIENVPGIQWILKGKFLEKIKQLLREMDYVVKVKKLKAEEYGVPQKRRRVFILGYRKGEHVHFPPEPLFAETDRYRFSSEGSVLLPTPPTVKDAISDLPPLKPREGSEVTIYDDSWIDTDYQRWSRNLLSFEEYYMRLKNSSQL